jgi:hypothetical protein
LAQSIDPSDSRSEEPMQDYQACDVSGTLLMNSQMEGPESNLGTDEKRFWVRCYQCEQWRRFPGDFGIHEYLCCKDLFPWVGKDNGRWTGGCNSRPEMFNAFDSALLKRDLTLEIICNCTEDLLHKLPKEALKVKWDIIRKLNSCATCGVVADMVCFLSFCFRNIAFFRSEALYSKGVIISRSIFCLLSKVHRALLLAHNRCDLFEHVEPSLLMADCRTLGSYS